MYKWSREDAPIIHTLKVNKFFEEWLKDYIQYYINYLERKEQDKIDFIQAIGDEEIVIDFNR